MWPVLILLYYVLVISSLEEQKISQPNATPVQVECPTELSSPQPRTSVEVDLSKRNLTDSDMKRVIEEEIIGKNVISLNMSENKITHNGIAILATVLQNNKVRNTMFLRGSKTDRVPNTHMCRFQKIYMSICLSLFTNPFHDDKPSRRADSFFFFYILWIKTGK